MPGFILENSVISDTYFRGINLLGTKKITIKNNVLYNIVGFGIGTSKADET